MTGFQLKNQTCGQPPTLTACWQSSSHIVIFPRLEPKVEGLQPFPLGLFASCLMLASGCLLRMSSGDWWFLGHLAKLSGKHPGSDEGQDSNSLRGDSPRAFVTVNNFNCHHRATRACGDSDIYA